MWKIQPKSLLKNTLCSFRDRNSSFLYFPPLLLWHTYPLFIRLGIQFTSIYSKFSLSCRPRATYQKPINFYIRLVSDFTIILPKKKHQQFPGTPLSLVRRCPVWFWHSAIRQEHTQLVNEFYTVHWTHFSTKT